MPYINSDHLLNEIEELKKSPWFNRGNGSGNPVEEDEYYVRKDAVECIVDVCIKKEPSADVAPIVHAHWTPKEHWVPLARDASPWSYDEDRYDYETHSQKELYWHCSHCDCIKSRIVKPVVPFCEQCGAQMDEEVEFIEDV